MPSFLLSAIFLPLKLIEKYYRAKRSESQDLAAVQEIAAKVADKETPLAKDITNFKPKSKYDLDKMTVIELKELAKHYGIYKSISTLLKVDLIKRILAFQESKQEAIARVTRPDAELPDKILTEEQLNAMTVDAIIQYAKRMDIYASDEMIIARRKKRLSQM